MQCVKLLGHDQAYCTCAVTRQENNDLVRIDFVGCIETVNTTLANTAKEQQQHQAEIIIMALGSR